MSFPFVFPFISAGWESRPTTFNNNYTCEECHLDCKTCNAFYSDNNTNCLSCSSEDKFLYLGNCVPECKNGYYNDTEDSSIKKCKCELENCLSCSIESLNANNSCITCNEEKGYFPLYDEVFNICNNNSFIKCFQKPKGYYLDKIESNYKKCYESCNDCNISGNDDYHNCVECDNEYLEGSDGEMTIEDEFKDYSPLTPPETSDTLHPTPVYTFEFKDDKCTKVFADRGL